MQQQNRTKKAGLSGLILVLVAVGLIPFAFAQEDAAKTAEEKAKRKAEIQLQIAELQKELAELETGETMAKDSVSALPSTYQQENANNALAGLRLIPIENVPAEELSKTILGIFPMLGAKHGPARMSVDKHSNTLLILTPNPELTDAVEAVVMQLDKPKKDKNENQPNMSIVVYTFSHIPAKDVLEHLSQTAEKGVRFSCDYNTNSLIVVAPEGLHEEIKAKILQLDQAPEKPKLDTEIEQSLKRKVEFAEKIYETIKVQVEMGARQGTALNEAQARYNKYQTLEDYQRWHYERAGTPEQKAEWGQKLRETLDSGQAAAKDWADAAMNHYNAGSAELKDVLTAQLELEDAIIRVLKFKEK